jgi:hypothetical protein
MGKLSMKQYRATWVSRKERNIWCCDFSGFGADRQALAAEIERSAATIREQSENSLLVAVYMHKPNITPELVEFFKTYSGQEKNPIHKMAILGVSNFEKFWFRRFKGISWPKNAAFFSDYDNAKDWLVGEVF